MRATSQAKIYRYSPKASRKTWLALGAICTHFSILELYVDRTIWALVGIDRKQGRKVTMRLLNHARLQKLRKAAIERFGEDTPSEKRYRKLAQLIDRLIVDRNLYVHGIWSKGKERGTRRQQFILTYFKDPDGEAFSVDLKKMNRFIEMISSTTSALELAAIEHLGKPLP